MLLIVLIKYKINCITFVLLLDPAQESQSEEMEDYCKILHIRRTGKVLKKVLKICFR